MTTVCVLGGFGQMGHALQRVLSPNFICHTLGRDVADVTQADQIRAVLEKIQPDVVINAAAYTAVDRAEDEATQANLLNAHAAQHVASVCAALDVPLIHLSTDYVFDGQIRCALTETEQPHPLSAYGKSKYEGEQWVQRTWDKHIILRLSGVFAHPGQNFVKAMLQLFQQHETVRVVADQITCPTYADDIAGAIAQLIALLPQRSAWGVYHYASANPLSWAQFAEAILEKVKVHQPVVTQHIEAITTEAYGAKAPRPAYAVLNCDKIKKQFDIAQPDWSKGLDKFLCHMLSTRLSP
ncbi:MAG: NAD(P)-dependent oxidoreductase [marine bacterium B5-7]|nr:MAG: NAD(P)-dependent oxidoreductase [marine bacterium B5-7]